MENNIEKSSENVEDKSYYRLSKKASMYLNETSKWTKFISILGFCLIALLVVLGFSFSTLMSMFYDGPSSLPFPGIFVSLIYIVFGAIYFIPILYLFKFSVFIKKSLLKNDMKVFEKALQNLKSHYKFMGILIIIVLLLYLLMGIGMLFMTLMSV